MKKRTSAFFSLVTAACLAFSSLPVAGATANEATETEKTLLTDADLDAALHEEGLTHNPDRASVHDPSIVTTTDENGKTLYYVFGTHMAAAKSYDLTNWEQVYNGYRTDYPLFGIINEEGETEPIAFNEAFTDNAFKGTVDTIINGEAAETDFGSYNATNWHTALNNYNVDGNLWAPDVIYNEKAGKWHMYMSLNGYESNSVIVLLSADDIEGPYVYEGPVVYSGFSSSTEALSYKNSDLELIYGELDTLPAKYVKANKTDWGNYWPHAIDPCVYYDEDGNLRMTYGSWSGGIYDLHLDENTGLRDYTVAYEDIQNGQNITSDKYFGTHIAGGYYASGEASYMKYMNGKYYLFITNGDLGADGNYQMRIFSSDSPTGPFADTNGQPAIYDSLKINYNSNYGHIYTGTDNGVAGSTAGARLMTNYKWNFMSDGEVSQGHNSVLVNEDGAFVIYHTRFDNGIDGHQLRVHQLYTVGDGALVAAPCEYDALLEDKSSYTAEEAGGSYDVIWGKYDTNPHWVGGSTADGGSLQYPGSLDCETSVQTELAADGTVLLKNKVIGSWELAEDGKYGTITINDTISDEHLIGTYDCIFIEQNAGGKKTTCFTGMNADTGISIWGCSNIVSDARAIALTTQNVAASIPSRTSSLLALPTKGVSDTKISWESNAPEILSNKGMVRKPDVDTKVTLTATISSGDYYYVQKYPVIVEASGSSLSDVTANLPSADFTAELDNPFYKKYLNQLYIRYTMTLADTSKTDGLGGLFSFYGKTGSIDLHSAPYVSCQEQNNTVMEINKPDSTLSDVTAGTAYTYEILIDRETDSITMKKDGTEISLEDKIHAQEGIAVSSILDYISLNCDKFSWGTANGTEICTLENVIITDNPPLTAAFDDSYNISSTTAPVVLDNAFANEKISLATLEYTVTYPDATVDAYGGLFAFYKSSEVGTKDAIGRISFHAMPYICYNDQNGNWMDIKAEDNPNTIAGNTTYTYKYIISDDELTLYVNNQRVFTAENGSGASYGNLLSYLSGCDKLSMGITGATAYWGSANATVSDMNFTINTISKVYPPYVTVADKEDGDTDSDNNDNTGNNGGNTDSGSDNNTGNNNGSTDSGSDNNTSNNGNNTIVTPPANENTGNGETIENDKPKNVTVGRVTIKSVKNQKGKKMLVKWKKVSGASGYQLQYSTNKKFKKSKTTTVKVKKGKTTSKTIKKLKKGKKYYVKIRAYKTVKGKTYYGKYSKVKQVTIKK